MVYKRPLGEEEIFTAGYKHPRHMDYSNELSSFEEIRHCGDSPEKTYASGEISFTKRHVSDIISEFPLGGHMKFEIGAPGSISSSWITDGYNGKHPKSEAAVQVSPFPDILEPDYATRLVQSEEMCPSYFDYSPRKLVSVGSNHQADIPGWGLKDMIKASTCSKTSDSRDSFSQCSDSDSNVDEDHEEKLMGACVIPMPNVDMLAYNSDNLGHGVADCSCPHRGSVRCVRLHIMESRDRLRATIGHETFVELGFYEMGEVVARKWSEEEERVFHEVVYTNSASSGKNFWDHLSDTFPSRTKNDLVSYYFNVFMLRRRAEQNRLDSLDIDSDNDEWEGSDEEEYASGTAEEDEDSVVESPRENHIYDEEHFHEEDDGDETSGDAQKFYGDFSFDGDVRVSCKSSQSGGEDNDVQDDSCMSYECQADMADFNGQSKMGTATQVNQVENDHGEHLQCNYNGRLTNGIVEHGYVLGSYDAKVWDDGYFSGLNEDVDFLPTSNMIEEVFGYEAWNNKGSDGKGHQPSQ